MRTAWSFDLELMWLETTRKFESAKGHVFFSQRSVTMVMITDLIFQIKSPSRLIMASILAPIEGREQGSAFTALAAGAIVGRVIDLGGLGEHGLRGCRPPVQRRLSHPIASFPGLAHLVIFIWLRQRNVKTVVAILDRESALQHAKGQDALVLIVGGLFIAVARRVGRVVGRGTRWPIVARLRSFKLSGLIFVPQLDGRVALQVFLKIVKSDPWAPPRTSRCASFLVLTAENCFLVDFLCVGVGNFKFLGGLVARHSLIRD